ncbi:MAG: short-chain fatty acid transporter [Phycisphaerales bacterium]|nr:short-chain fatty acid transporter [Phycisphaerales bacterium]
MISRLGLAISGIFRRTCPDPFILAIGLTVVTGGLIAWLQPDPNGAGVLTAHSLADLIGYWQGGFWDQLTFAMQMCLILVTGHALASSPPIRRLIRGIASLPRSAPAATLLVALVAMLGGVVHWGLGLIAGALIARDVGHALQRRGIAHHYPLLAAAGYLGLLVWHGGFSGSAPLKMTTAADVASVFGADAPYATIPLTGTIASTSNLVITGVAVLLAAGTVMLLVPRRDEDMVPCGTFDVADPPARTWPPMRSLPDVLDGSPLMSVVLALPILLYLFSPLVIRLAPSVADAAWLPPGPDWARFGPNQVNALFLALGLVMHGTPRRYLAAVDDAVRGCAGIILQFPLYAGIMGLMASSGLTTMLSDGIARTADADTLPLFTFVGAAIVNLFVPSGGGQWVVQGPIAMDAARELGADPARIVMSVAYGDQLTNMLQPFWALPLLAITGVRARDIVGYTAIVMLVVGAWIALALWLL